MTDRGQMGQTPTWLPVTLTVVAVLTVVAAELRDAVTAVEGPIEYCGLCHVDYPSVAAEIAVILILTYIASLIVSFPKRVPDAEEERDE